MQENSLTAHVRQDLPASIVVFLVAVPLCLGIALASGAPLFSGLVAGVVGGIVVGLASGSPLGVSGPAAGLAVIVLNAIGELGSFGVFLTAVIIAGVVACYFPSSVIDATDSVLLDDDVVEIIEEERSRAASREITLELIGFDRPVRTLSVEVVEQAVKEAAHRRRDDMSWAGGRK